MEYTDCSKIYKKIFKKSIWPYHAKSMRNRMHVII